MCKVEDKLVKFETDNVIYIIFEVKQLRNLKTWV